MKLLFWLFAGVFLLQLSTLVESRAEPEYETALRFERGIKDWIKNVWQKLKDAATKLKGYLSGFVSKLKPKLENFMKTGETLVKDATKALKKGKKSIDKKLKERITQFAFSLQNGAEFTKEAEEKVEKQVKEMIKAEENISKDLVKCSGPVKDAAAKLKTEHKKLFGKCKEDSFKALAQAARIVLSSIIESLPAMKEGLAKTATAWSEDDKVTAITSFCGSFSDAYATFKTNWKGSYESKVKPPLDKAAKCIVEAHDKASAEWDALSKQCA